MRRQGIGIRCVAHPSLCRPIDIVAGRTHSCFSKIHLFHHIRILLTGCCDQIITQHEPYELICEDTNLGFARSDKLVFIQIFQQGRTAEVKQQLYAKLAERLEKECGVPGEDLVVTCVRNEKEDWSFGKGRAQFLTGEL